MIKWNSNFQIENSMIQLAEAIISIQSFENMGKKCNVTVVITDETLENIARIDSHTIDGNFSNEEDIYPKLLAKYPDSKVA